MNYKKHYNLLIKKAQNRLLESGTYKETHHIIPRCMGGYDNQENLVELTPEEHYVAHQLLVKMYPKHRGLVWAALQLAGGRNKNGGNRINNKSYGWLKQKNSKRVSLQNKERWKNLEYRDKIIKKLSKHVKKQWKKEEFRNNMIEQCKENWKRPEYRNAVVVGINNYWSDSKNKENASKQRQGKPNGSYGKYWYYNPETLDTIKCLPEKVPEGYIKGRTKIPNNTKCKICNIDTNSIKAKYCKVHRKENRKKLLKARMKTVDLGKSKRKCSNKEIEDALNEHNYNVSKAMKSLGYLSDGGNTRHRFTKILKDIKYNK